MLEIIILAIALSMDAFAVSIALGVKNRHSTLNLAIKAGLFFGIFQAIMPLIGYLGGVGLKSYLAGFDSLIAFILLLLIGSKMIYEALNENVEDEITMISNKILLTLAIATSIDAMAAGFTLHLFNLNPFMSIALIGIITFIFSILGVYLGTQGGAKYESKAEIFGGITLILIGVKILLF
jgi:putative Mn2+ efflux pump MntP